MGLLKIESLEINPCTYGYLTFDKRGKNIQWVKDSKQMERDSMFLGRKNPYCENDYTTI